MKKRIEEKFVRKKHKKTQEIQFFFYTEEFLKKKTEG